MKGVYQHCGHNHLNRYLAEFDFRYSNREKRVKINGKWEKVGYSDTERADQLLLGVKGKRLTYQTTH